MEGWKSLLEGPVGATAAGTYRSRGLEKSAGERELRGDIGAGSYRSGGLEKNGMEIELRGYIAAGRNRIAGLEKPERPAGATAAAASYRSRGLEKPAGESCGRYNSRRLSK